MMTRMSNTEIEVSHFYGDGDRLKAVVTLDGDCYHVDFYKDEVMIDSRRVEGHTLRYAEDMAENFVNGVIRIDPRTWRLQGV